MSLKKPIHMTSQFSCNLADVAWFFKSNPPFITYFVLNTVEFHIKEKYFRI